MIFDMNQGKKRRSGPLELIIHNRVSSLMVSNQLLHKLYKYNAKTNANINKMQRQMQIQIQIQIQWSIRVYNSQQSVLTDGQ